jgi:hypothetical protein
MRGQYFYGFTVWLGDKPVDNQLTFISSPTKIRGLSYSEAKKVETSFSHDFSRGKKQNTDKRLDDQV